MIGCENSGTAVGFALFPPTKMRSTNETLQPAHAGTNGSSLKDKGIITEDEFQTKKKELLGRI